MAIRRRLNLGILASGTGTNLQAIIDAAEADRLDARVGVVISDTPSAFALERARQHGIPAWHIDRSAFADRESFENEIARRLTDHDVDLVCLAGFMRIVGRQLLTAFPSRIVNIHPALLPAFPGLHGQRQAFDYGVKVAGCTVHFIDNRVDHGPIIRQAAVEVREDDTVEALAERILAAEHRIYVEAIQLIAEGRVSIEGRRVRISERA